MTRARTGTRRPLRIGYGRICQETNAFSPVASELEDFRRLQLLEGPELHAVCGRWRAEVPGMIHNAELSGFRQACRRAPRGAVEPVPLVSAWAMPSGPLSEPTFEDLRERLLASLRAAGPLDGVFLALHGAMRGAGDAVAPEESFLADVREVVGEDVPIAVTYDLHGQLTPAKVDPATVLVAYRTNPHRDLARAGRHAGSLLLRALRGEVAPVSTWRSLPMILGGGTTIDLLAPMRRVFRRMKAMERDRRVLSVSLFMCHPFNDAPDLGWSCHVTTDGDPALAEALADELADLAWGVRDVEPPRFLPPDEALGVVRRARWARRTGTVCAVDVSDVVGAGGTGENTNLLRACLEGGRGLRSYVPVRDAAAVGELWGAEPGDVVELSVGGRLHPEVNPPVDVQGRVRTRTTTEHFGRAVTLDLDHVQLVLTEGAPLPLKPRFYRDVGLEPARADLVVVKNFFHYRIYFALLNRKSVPVRTRGVTDLDRALGQEFHDPVHPRDEVADWRPADRRRRGLEPAATALA